MKKVNNKILENKFINIDKSDLRSVKEALQRKQLAGTAKIVQDYEQKLSTYFGIKHALAVSSGTAALHLLLYLYDVKPGDEVIIPPTAPIMSALPILAMYAKPVFVDVNVSNFGFETVDLKKRITKKTKAVVIVPMWGYPVNMKDVRRIAKENSVAVIEDASHCHGAKINNKFVGTMSDVSFFSTQERKLVTTGEGAFILTNSQYVSDRVRELRNFGKPVRKIKDFKKYFGEYGHLFGLNFRISAMSAGLGISQLTKIRKKISTRTRNAYILKKELARYEWLKEIEIPKNYVPNYYSIVYFVNHKKVSAFEVAKILYGKNIVSDTYRFGIKPLYEMPIFKKYKSNCPNAVHILKNIITLPTHEGLDKSDLKRIVNAFKEIDKN